MEAPEQEAALAPVDSKKSVGRWKPGQSGNPKGRPKASLVALQRDLEGAIRDHLTADKVKRIVDAIVDKATRGDVKAAKLILDKLVPNATDTEQSDDSGRTVVFRIENATFAAQQAQPPALEPPKNPPIDVQVVEVVKSESNGKS